MTTTRWLSEEEERTWRAYRSMRTLLDLQIGRDLARDSGLSEPDYDVLSTLTEQPDGAAGAGASWRATALAERLRWSTSRLAHQVGRMERRGLVRRQACADDGRGAAVVLTEQGWQVLAGAARDHVASVRRHLIDLLTPAEVATLGVIAAKVTRHLTGG